ncbi:MAG: hypothetical protein DRO93_08760 [Candidatus Thorarchaeota archaeon]|nr:MAG: hypothetical protein DRO93_08760 [Candidatus Thorarchaeota archaeon]
MRFNLSGNSQIFSVLIIFLLVSTMFSSFANSLKVSNNDHTKYIGNNEYIVELVDEPLFKYSSIIKKNVKNSVLFRSKIDEYRLSLLDAHRKTKNSILSVLKGENKHEIVFSHDFYGIFNGFCIKNLPKSFIDKLKNLSFVKNVFPNYHFKVALDESVPLINADKVWNLHDKSGRNIRGYGIKIAILDTGVDYTHPDIADSYAGGYDFVNNDDDPMDDNGHGTHCAGILVGNGVSSSYKYVGVAPDADLYVYKILDNKGDAGFAEFVKGLEAAVDPNDDGDPSDHVDVLSLSFGTENPGSPDDPISLKVDEVVDMGVVVAVAAGNLGPTNGSVSSPGCSLKAITVGSVNKNSEIAYSSSRGPVEYNNESFVKPDVVAPGVSITSTSIGGGYISKSGTSMATPHVAGAAALLLQAHPDWSPAKVKEELEKTAVDLGESGKDNVYGSGLINVLKAINLSSAPPIALLTVNDVIPKGLVNINGTAMNGTGNSEDFVNYTVYYKKDDGWIKIFEDTNEVSNDVLCQWNTSELESGFYKLKLDVRSKDQTSIFIKNVTVGFDDQKIFISAPSKVVESTRFKVNLTDINKTPIKAVVILLVPFSIPRIKYGSNVEFKAPVILNPFLDSLDGRILVFRLSESLKAKKPITVVNKRI